MAYDFRLINKENQRILTDFKILIDDEAFSLHKDYNFKPKRLIFENLNGRVQIDGYLELPTNPGRIPDIVKINKTSIRFDPEFIIKNSNREMFTGLIVSIVFFQVRVQERVLDSIEVKKFADQLGGEFFVVEGGFLGLKMRKLKDLDLKVIIGGRVKTVTSDENIDYFNRSELSGAGFNINLNEKEMFKLGKRHLDEFGVERNFEEEVREDHLRPNKDTEISAAEESESFIQPFKDFIDFESDESNFQFIKDERTDKHMIDPYHVSSEDKLKKFRKSFHNFGLKPCFNKRGELITLGKFNSATFRHDIKISKITPNIELTASDDTCYNYYHKNTFHNYLKILNSHLENILLQSQGVSQKESIDSLGVNDYTMILNNYINELIKHRDGLSNISNIMLKEIKNKISSKMNKEISVLKLFKILFLNSYSEKTNLNSNRQVESFREEVKRMRKKKLIDWLIENTEEQFLAGYNQIIKSDTSASTKNTTQYKLIFHCLTSGRIRKAVDLCNKNGLFNLAMLISQTNSEVRSAMVGESLANWEKLRLDRAIPEDLRNIYEILAVKEADSQTSLKKVLKDLDWERALLYNLIYSAGLNVGISSVLQGFKHSSRAAQYNHLRNIGDIRFILISLYSAIEAGGENSQTHIEELLINLMDPVNLQDSMGDSHIQYIIITILLNTLKETYNYNSIVNSLVHVRTEELGNYSFIFNFKLLKQLHFKLLLKVVEELLITQTQTSDSISHWKLAVSLIRNSNTPRSLQRHMINDILYKFTDITKSDSSFYDLTIFDPKVTNNAAGFYYYNQFKFNDAYNSFKFAHNFEKANEIFIFHKLALRMIDNNVTNDIIEELNYLAANCLVSGKIFESNWEKYGVIFHEYLNLVERFAQEDFEPGVKEMSLITGLMKKVEAMNANVGDSNRLVVNYCRNIMLGNLRKMYNQKLNNKNRDVSVLVFYIYI